MIERSTLGRLRAEEAYLERRRANIVNLGHTWLKPPGVSKTLFQLREERREAEEHAEAMRREQLAQDLAEAAEAETEGTGVAGGGGGGGGPLDEGNPMDALDMDVDRDDPLLGGGEGEVDLDDEIPDADEGGFGYDGASDEEEDDDDDDEEEDEDEGLPSDGEGYDENPGRGWQPRTEQQEEVANMRANEERMREMMMARNQGGGRDVYGEEEDELDGEDPGHMLEEDDLVHVHHEAEEGMDMDMDANLDDDIPEAGSGGYEHTDSEASFGDSEEDEDSFATGRAAQVGRPRSSLPQSDRARNSLDLNSILSGDGSSIIGSSPHVRRRN